jgi:Uri superfamily endonuclease
MEPVPGTYVLVLKSEKKQTAKIGKLGRLLIYPGWYIYVGSALGSGGLRARIHRHTQKRKKLRWHIDYLRFKINLVAVWYATNSKKLECEWASIFQLQKGSIPIPKFGSSDCKCFSHLFFFKNQPDCNSFSKQVTVPIFHSLMLS